jgi:hypothetical protein
MYVAYVELIKFQTNYKIIRVNFSKKYKIFFFSFLCRSYFLRKFAHANMNVNMYMQVHYYKLLQNFEI